MSYAIQPGYGTKGYPSAAKPGKTKGTRTTSFLDAAGQAHNQDTAMPVAAGRNGTGTEFLPAKLMLRLTAHSATQIQGVRAAEAPSLEAMLKTKYPSITYHVFDASSNYWKTRNDYPHYLLYQSGDEAKETLENWQPSGENPFYGSIDGKFTAPKEIHALGNVPPGSKAVVIHPAVQERMEQDPEYAMEIFAKIDTWFSFDAARNEAIIPGSAANLSQAVAIGEDGNICNACTSSSGGSFTKSGDEMVRAYYLRMAKRADFMRWLVQEQMEDKILENGLAESAAAKAQLASLLHSGKLVGIFGSEISGVPTETVLSITQAKIWGSQKM